MGAGKQAVGAGSEFHMVALGEIQAKVAERQSPQCAQDKAARERAGVSSERRDCGGRGAGE